jgi:hypothetical protein
MWTRQPPEQYSDAEERQEGERLKSLLSRNESGEQPHADYWQNLIGGTNRRVDDVSSAKALSISWVARVAIPGAVAILFFFIGLHYYVPERETNHVTVTEIISGLPLASQDSLLNYLMERAFIPDSDLVFNEDILDLSEYEVEQYLTASENTAVLLEALPEEEFKELLSLLQNSISQKRVTL